MKSCCSCPECRRKIRERIEAMFRKHPRFMVEVSIRFYARLDCVPRDLFHEILKSMVLHGQLIKSICRGECFPRYLSSRVMVPVRVLAESTERRGQ